MVVIVVGVVGGGVIASHIGADVGCPCAPGFVGAHRVIIVVVVGVIGIICGCEFLIEFVLRVLDVAVGDNGGAQCIEHVVDDRVWVIAGSFAVAAKIRQCAEVACPGFGATVAALWLT